MRCPSPAHGDGPPEMVVSVASTVSETNRTEPSQREWLAPPEWLLLALIMCVPKFGLVAFIRQDGEFGAMIVLNDV